MQEERTILFHKEFKFLSYCTVSFSTDNTKYLFHDDQSPGQYLLFSMFKIYLEIRQGIPEIHSVIIHLYLLGLL